MIYSKNGHFIDEKGRILIFKGCNFSADAKIPVIPDGSTHKKDSLNRGKISFVGRPCRLDEADQHFKRMKSWGFNFLRFLITWEAIEPEEPGVYDKEYLDYIKEILKRAADYGFYIYIDPHQDIYSRFSGGDGAPWWTFDKIGIDVEKIGQTFSALLHKDYGKNYPSMIWPTNYNRYAAATMFTLFFGGNDFAPHLKVEGENIQDYLQTKYINAIKQLAKVLVDNKNIVGFGSMNEPHPGFIGYTDLNKIQNCSYAKGYIPTGFESMMLASGFPTYINKLNEGFFGYKPIGKKIFNEKGISLFKDGFICPWRKEGVWDIVNGKPKLLRHDYFSKANGKNINFANDYLKHFIIKFQNEINQINDNWFTIIEGIPHGKAPEFEEKQTKKMIHGFHWYDGMPMVLKAFSPYFSIRGDTRRPVFGKKNIVNSYFEQLKNMKENTVKNMGNMPCLLGEFGLPLDIFNGISFKLNNFKIPNTAISMFYDAIDRLMLSSTIWTYCVDNNHKWGDNWNKEDFSIYCKQDIKNKRGTPGFLRPYSIAINGIPQSFYYDKKNKTIELSYQNEFSDNKDSDNKNNKDLHNNKNENIYDFNKENPSLIFIPENLYTKRLKLDLFVNNEKIGQDDYKSSYNEENSILSICVEKKGQIKIKVYL